MRIYQNKKTNKWYFEFMLEGKRYHYACKGATDRKEAEQFAYDYKSNVYKGKQGYVKCNTTKLDKLIEIYLDYSKTNKKSYSLDCYYCRNFKGFIGNRYIDEIKLIDIEKFKSFRKNTVSNSTINRELNSISKMFSIAVENKLLSENPCFSVKKLRKIFNKRRRRKTFKCLYRRERIFKTNPYNGTAYRL